MAEVSASTASGTHRAASAAQNGGNPKPSGITPTTSYGSPSNVRLRPTHEGSPPKRVRHRSQERTTTRSRPGVPSSGRKVRPYAASTPSRSNRLAVALRPGMRCGTSEAGGDGGPGVGGRGVGQGRRRGGEIGEVGRRHRATRRSLLGIEHRHQARRVAVGQRRQQHRAGNAVEADRGGDAERQGEDDGGREAAVVDEVADRLPQLADQLHLSAPPGRVGAARGGATATEVPRPWRGKSPVRRRSSVSQRSAGTSAYERRSCAAGTLHQGLALRSRSLSELMNQSPAVASASSARASQGAATQGGD